MEKDTLTTVTEDDDILLPDGFGEGDDFFDPESWSGAAEQTDESGNADGEQDEEIGDSQEGGEVLAMGQDAGEEAQSAAEEGPDTSDGMETPAKSARQIRFTHNHKEETINVDEMPDEELVAHIQKSRAFDKQRYREIYQKQIYEGMTPEAAKMIATAEVGKTFALEDKSEQDTQSPAENASQMRNPVEDVVKLKALYPDLKEIPDEVAKAYDSGVPLLTAYLAYRDRQSAKANASLKKENEILKQNAVSASRAPVRGVSTGGKIKQPKQDPLLIGFNSDDY